MLHFHAGENHVQKLRSALISGEEDVDDLDLNGWTALQHAASSGKNALSAMQLLVDFNATLDIQNKKGDTALHIASQTKQMEPLRLLLQAGADLHLQNSSGDTAADIFEREGWDRTLKDDIEAGRQKREDFARIKREAAEKAAMERKKALAKVQEQPQADGRAQVPLQTRRAQYMDLRDHVALKMKRSKAAHRRGVEDMGAALGKLWEETKEEQAREADIKAGWRTVRSAHVLQEEGGRQQLQHLQALGLADTDVDATRSLIVGEAEADLLGEERLRVAAAFGDVAEEVAGVEARMRGLDRLFPLLHLLRSSLRLSKDRAVVEAEQRREYEAKVAAYEARMEEEEAQRREEEEAEMRRPVLCARCGATFVRDHTNKPTSCRFHVGEKGILANFASGYTCCGRLGIGCRMAEHTTGEEVQYA